MRVLVTGNNGYIGTVLTPLLRQAGHEVVGMDANLFERCTFLGEIPNIPTICKDIREASEADIAGFDAIIHLAGLSNDPLGDYRPELTRQYQPSRRSASGGAREESRRQTVLVRFFLQQLRCRGRRVSDRRRFV